jgi:hypothetical protein
MALGTHYPTHDALYRVLLVVYPKRLGIELNNGSAVA